VEPDEKTQLFRRFHVDIENDFSTTDNRETTMPNVPDPTVHFIDPIDVGISVRVMVQCEYGKGNSSAEFCVAQAADACQRGDFDAAYRWHFKAIIHHDGVDSAMFRDTVRFYTEPF